jgi:NTP pyrophosphatase (non-canonical NTP hydrolase)
MDKHRQLEEYKKMLSDAIDTDGIDFCIDCLVEECAELIVAIRHYRRGRTNVNKVIEEMADVNLMCDMVRVGLDNEIGFSDIIKQKSIRVGERIAFKKSKK